MKDLNGTKMLSDEALEDVIGGAQTDRDTRGKEKIPRGFCPKCKDYREVRIASGGRAFCKVCNERIDM